MSRLSSMGRTPISERIKVFDASSSPKKTPPRTPSRPREASITPSVDLKPVPARSHQPPSADRNPRRPTDGLRRVDKVNRTDSSNGSSRTSVTRSDSSAKTRVTRTDSIRSSSSGVGGSSSSSISASSRKAVTGVSSSSPRVGKKPLTAASQPVGKGKASPQNSNTKNASSSSSSSKTTTSRSSSSSKSPPSANSQQGRPAPGHKKEEQPKSSSSGSNQDVKPDVIADIEHDRAASEDVSSVGGEGEGGAETLPVVFPPPDSASANVGPSSSTITEEAPCDDERQAPELVTAKLIRDMRGDEAVSQEVTRDAADDENCDNHEKKEELDASLSRRESVDEQVKKKSIIVNVEEVEQPRKESVMIQGDESQITKKKSLMEVEAESPYLRKKSLKEAMLDSSSSSYNSMRKTSLVSSSKSYMRKESVKEQLEDLVDKQYFTKQALNNATSTTINQVIKTS